MALQHYFLGEPIRIVDATTGEVYQTLSLPSARLVGWADDEHLTVQERGEALPIPLRGWPALLHVGSSDGLTTEAAELTFGAKHPT
jgi:hypothetical protein